MSALRKIPPGRGQESVWDYPRPPRAEPCARRIQVLFAGATVADSRRSVRVLETSHPPVYYLPPEDVRLELLAPNPRLTWCEFKGEAVYFDLVVGGRRATAAAWSYPRPTSAFASLADHLAFYPSAADACLVDGERARAQAGDFYGGWITAEIVGPFKGEPGSGGW